MIECSKCLGDSIQDAMIVHVDTQGVIMLVRNPVLHDCSKHIDIQYHYMQELAKSGIIELEYLPMKEMLADLLTKPLACSQHEFLACGIRLF